MLGDTLDAPALRACFGMTCALDAPALRACFGMTCALDFQRSYRPRAKPEWSVSFLVVNGVLEDTLDAQAAPACFGMTFALDAQASHSSFNGHTD